LRHGELGFRSRFSWRVIPFFVARYNRGHTVNTTRAAPARRKKARQKKASIGRMDIGWGSSREKEEARMTLARFAITTMVLLLSGGAAHAKVMTLKCTPGYSCQVTVTLRTADGNQTHQLSCPPTSSIDLGNLQYDGIQADFGITDPAGNTTSGTLPAGPGSPPTYTDNSGFAPWGSHPRSPRSYICDSVDCITDPAAPVFLQAGEFLLGEYTKGTNHELTAKVVDGATGSAIEGAGVKVVKADGSEAGAAKTRSDGQVEFKLPTGGEYSLRVEHKGFHPHASEEFQLLHDHAWTMRLIPDTRGPIVTPPPIQTQTPPDDGSRWVLIASILLLLIAMVFFVKSRRRP
jgi:hypothetical protein